MVSLIPDSNHKNGNRKDYFRMEKVVILGGGYGGLTIVNKLLEQVLPHDVTLTLIDRMPFQGLKTEYYALVAGTVSDYHLRVPFPVHPRLDIRHGEVIRIDPENRLVEMANSDPVPYDRLIIALGCTDNYHGIPGAREYACSIQSMESARETYCKVNNLPAYSTVTIVGGGLSGVEVAAELRESRPDLNLRIMDRGPSILSPFPEKLRAYVREWFIEHEVEMVPHSSISRLEPGIVYNGDQAVGTDVTIWTAGIQPVPVVQQLDLPKDGSGRLVINEYHQLPDYPEVFVVGDCASLPFSPSAQAAEAQGKQVAEVLHAIWKNETPRIGKIKLKGVLGSLGKKAGFGFGIVGRSTVMLGRVPRVLKSGVLWMSKRHLG